MHDVSHVTATHLPELEARKADLLERRSRVTAAATEAGAQLSAAQQKLADVAKAFAADTSDLKAGSAAQNAIRTAESAVAVTQEALKHLSAEDAQLEAELKVARHMQAVLDHRAICDEADQAARELDEQAAKFNAAFDKWKTARVRAFSSFPLQHEAFSAPRPFPAVGAGVLGSTSLHPQIVNDISHMGGMSPPARGPVAFHKVPRA